LCHILLIDTFLRLLFNARETNGRRGENGIMGDWVSFWEVDTVQAGNLMFSLCLASTPIDHKVTIIELKIASVVALFRYLIIFTRVQTIESSINAGSGKQKEPCLRV